MDLTFCDGKHAVQEPEAKGARVMQMYGRGHMALLWA